MEIPHEHDINIGKIFSGLVIQRLYKNKQYENKIPPFANMLLCG